MSTEPQSHCSNCQTRLVGRWCHACGQKVIGDRERRFGHLLAQFAHELFHVDGKLVRTGTTLLFRPGRLSRAYLSGQRVDYLSPIALFLVINLLYFLAPPLTDFSLDLNNQLHQPYGELIRPVVEQRLAARDITLEAYQPLYNERTNHLSKSLIILHLPLLALALLVLFPRRMYYAEHFVVATHMFSFFLAAILGVTVIALGVYGALSLTGLMASPAGMMPAALATLLGLVLLWWLVALRRVYAIGWIRAVVSLLGAVVGFQVAHMFIYRPLQFLLVFALT